MVTFSKSEFFKSSFYIQPSSNQPKEPGQQMTNKKTYLTRHLHQVHHTCAGTGRQKSKAELVEEMRRIINILTPLKMS